MLRRTGEVTWQVRNRETGERITLTVERVGNETKVGIDADRDRWAIEQVEPSRLEQRI